MPARKGKKAAFVKPIKASDERTLENAIIMANQLASKSMHDLDKRCADDMFNASPQVSPLTPNSPTKKFTFKFPSTKARSSSPKPGRHFTDEVSGPQTDLESFITPTAKNAYDALINGDKNTSDKLDSGSTTSRSSTSTLTSTSSHRLSLPPTAFSKFSFPHAIEPVDPPIPEVSNNPLPLPPKDRKSSVTSGKRHVRKNPLIMTSGAAASMARRFETEENTAARAENDAAPSHSMHTQKTKNTHKQFSPMNDAAPSHSMHTQKTKNT